MSKVFRATGSADAAAGAGSASPLQSTRTGAVSRHAAATAHRKRGRASSGGRLRTCCCRLWGVGQWAAAAAALPPLCLLRHLRRLRRISFTAAQHKQLRKNARIGDHLAPSTPPMRTGRCGRKGVSRWTSVVGKLLQRATLRDAHLLPLAAMARRCTTGSPRGISQGKRIRSRAQQAADVGLKRRTGAALPQRRARRATYASTADDAIDGDCRVANACCANEVLILRGGAIMWRAHHSGAVYHRGSA